MFTESFYTLATLIPIGIGLLFLGIANQLLRHHTAGIRFFGLLSVIVGATISILPFGAPPSIPSLVGGTLLGLTLLLVIAKSSPIYAMICWTGRVFRTTAFQSALMGITGLGIVVFGFFKVEADEDASLNNELSALERIVWKPPLHPKSEAMASTDAGHTVLLHTPDHYRSSEEMESMELKILEQMKYNFALIRHNRADDGTNCHGWVFTGGQYWLAPDMVAVVLADNGYHPVVIPQIGDLVVYHEGHTLGITHTAVVRYVGNDSPIVEGKWGWMGVFLHPVDQSCYGSNFTYYRSDREGHLLVGLGGKPHRVVMPPAIDMELPRPRH